ncbi:MAG: hypothetical protein ACFFBD_11010 [Candidatus Hodarchaeota archaeon]
MFSICTAYIENGKIEETLKQTSKSEANFTEVIGVKFRKFFQCKIQPHILWSLTEWESEKQHHTAAQSIMKTRYDDRFASIAFGPEPYFEIFCEEDEDIKIGTFSEKYELVIVIHVLIGEKVKEKYLELRKSRIEDHRNKIPWLRIFNNKYNSFEFVAYIGFHSEKEFNNIRQVKELFLEEYLFTGLRKPLDMSFIASYNQFFCTPINLSVKL